MGPAHCVGFGGVAVVRAPCEETGEVCVHGEGDLGDDRVLAVADETQEVLERACRDRLPAEHGGRGRGVAGAFWGEGTLGRAVRCRCDQGENDGRAVVDCELSAGQMGGVTDEQALIGAQP